MTAEVKRVYAFGKDAEGNNVTEGNTNMKAILGGKGANLAEMANIGLPVPPGFTITCQTCMEYANADNTWPEGALDTIHEYRLDLEKRIGKKIGDAEDPLLVSVRSGAPMSMPGMMDTVLNLGLNDQSINGLIKQTENPRFAWDSYRRFIQMFSNVVMGLDGDLFENAINVMKNSRKAASDTDLDRRGPAGARGRVQEDLLRERLRRRVSAAGWSMASSPSRRTPWCSSSWASRPCSAPGTPSAPASTAAVSASPTTWAPPSTSAPWCSATWAKTPAPACASPATPPPATPASTATTWRTPRARTSLRVSATPCPWPTLRTSTSPSTTSCAAIMRKLETHYRDMCDIEFTIERGKLWMLQTRVGKRTAAAAFRIAIQLVDEKLITRDEALGRVDRRPAHPADVPAVRRYGREGTHRSRHGRLPGRRRRRASSSTTRRPSAAAEAGVKCVLVRRETNPDDLPGMVAAEGVLDRAAAVRPPTPPSSPAVWARPACAASRPSRSTLRRRRPS